MEAKQEEFKLDIIEYDVQTAVIEKMKKDYMVLKIDGIKDTEGFEKVHNARMEVKTLRVKVQKREEEYKKQLNTKKKEVMDMAKDIYALLEPIETHLFEEENAVTQEKERIKREKAEAEQKRIDGIRSMIKVIQEHATVLPSEASEAINQRIAMVKNIAIDEKFEEFNEEAQLAKNETLLKLAEAKETRLEWEEQEEKRQAEAERLEDERKKQEEERKELESIAEQEDYFQRYVIGIDEKIISSANIEKALIVLQESIESEKTLPSVKKMIERQIVQTKHILNIRKEQESIKEEKAKITKERHKNREQALLTLGLSCVMSEEVYKYKDVKLSFEVLDYEVDEFEKLISHITDKIEVIKIEEAKEKAEAEAKAKAKKEKAEKEAKEREEVLKPDKEKFTDLAMKIEILAYDEIPFNSEEAINLYKEISIELSELSKNIIERAKAL